MSDNAFQLGSVEISVRRLDAGALDGLKPKFVALLPAMSMTRLPATIDIAFKLLGAGCADIILAGRCAHAFNEQVNVIINQEGAWTSSSPYEELSDACNATLLGALVHKAGVAFCGDEPETMDTLRGTAHANGWTSADGVEATGATKRTEKPKATAKHAKVRATAKGAGKAAAKAKAPPKPKPKPKRKQRR